MMDYINIINKLCIGYWMNIELHVKSGINV